ncbi:DJ-1/PfpI family protein [Sphingomonas sp. CFBP 8760]|uniref:DJ-1/PfpI family protein n=1 Tax=Sphingomonas sp. CFBP 8760 TaxID=2775282 RepID=UPI00177D5CFF|nr:DJ-1/PfpI family protein [Sphingomonas sp. CFBP 8760]MBD8548893.1 DJ-1/PfpI family protein [Sphingomonas sp. CFBP 8760]
MKITSYDGMLAALAPEGVAPFHVGILVGPGFVPMDIVGIQTVLAMMPGSQIHFIWKNRDVVEGFRSWPTVPTTTFETCPPLDVFAVGMNPPEVQNDPEVVAFTWKAAHSARYVIGICNGVALLGLAGLIEGRTVASNFAAEELLAELGAAQVLTSGTGVAVDGNLYTAGPGIGSFEAALLVAADAFGREAGELAEFAIEYDPHPPFRTGTVETASPQLVEAGRGMIGPIIAQYRR